MYSMGKNNLYSYFNSFTIYTYSLQVTKLCFVNKIFKLYITNCISVAGKFESVLSTRADNAYVHVEKNKINVASIT